MKLVRFSKGGKIACGVLRAETITVLAGDIYGDWRETKEQVALAETTLLSPVDAVSLLCIGKNYKAHADECGSDLPAAPLLFIKAISSLHGPGMPVVMPPPELSTQVDFEAELAVVIGKTAKNVSEADALQYVLGYTCANDVSARDCQFADGQWARGKSFDTFCPLGPWLETELDPSDLKIEGRLNGEVMQQSRTSLLIFRIPFLISYLSRGMTLTPGTVILSGTPAGCGFARKPPVWLKPGDTYEVEIEGVGTLRNRFVR